MKITKRLSTLGIVAFPVGALALISAPIATLSPAIAQEATINAYVI